MKGLLITATVMLTAYSLKIAVQMFLLIAANRVSSLKKFFFCVAIQSITTI